MSAFSNIFNDYCLIINDFGTFTISLSQNFKLISNLELNTFCLNTKYFI